MNETSFQHIIAFLVVSLFIAFTSGYVIGHRDRNASPYPSNFDVIGAVAENTLLRDEVKTCRQNQSAH